MRYALAAVLLLAACGGTEDDQQAVPAIRAVPAPVTVPNPPYQGPAHPAPPAGTARIVLVR